MSEQNADSPEQQQQSNENRSINDRDRRGGRNNRHRGGRGGAQQQQQSAKGSLNMLELRELADLISEHGFTDFEFENETIRVRLRKDSFGQSAGQFGGQFAPQQTQMPPQQFAPPASQQYAAPQQIQPQAAESAAVSNASAPPTNAATATAADDDANLRKIISPIVGTFYRSPSPEAEAFVKIGSQVSPDTTVCIVEAMKLMNEIPAETTGEIVKIYVENGQPVEYGQALFAVK